MWQLHMVAVIPFKSTVYGEFTNTVFKESHVMILIFHLLGDIRDM